MFPSEPGARLLHRRNSRTMAASSGPPAAMDLHPPKPRLTLRVGITGHRPDKLHGRAAARIEDQFPDVFAAIETAAADILRANAAVYASAPPLIRLISGFAE